MHCSSCSRSISSRWIPPCARSFFPLRASAPKSGAGRRASRLTICPSLPVHPRGRRPLQRPRRRPRRPMCRFLRATVRPAISRPPIPGRTSHLHPSPLPTAAMPSRQSPRCSRRSPRRTPMSAAAPSSLTPTPQATIKTISSLTAIRASTPIRAVRAWGLRVRRRTRARLRRAPMRARIHPT